MERPRADDAVGGVPAGDIRVMAPADRRSWSLLRGRLSARDPTSKNRLWKLPESRGRRERVHRSLENRQGRGFPQLPQALTLPFGNPKCYPCSRLTLLPIFPVAPGRVATRQGSFSWSSSVCPWISRGPATLVCAVLHSVATDSVSTNSNLEPPHHVWFCCHAQRGRVVHVPVASCVGDCGVLAVLVWLDMDFVVDCRQARPSQGERLGQAYGSVRATHR